MIRVSDIVKNPRKLKAVLIFESPHTKEVEVGYPLAGTSGMFVTDYIRFRAHRCSKLRDFSRPFGEALIKSSYNKIGIMNFSVWPLQASAYASISLTVAQQKIVNRFETIRSPSNSRRDPMTQKREDCLLRYFSIRISNILNENPDVLFIPCGHVARNFLNKSDAFVRLLPEEVPHPSRGAWVIKDTPEFDKVISKL